jgi:2-keto-4-pentenoate hydratase/2-oxohepta-3-ene-1,7-dioic acid hydratase in catechol pathway
MKLVRFGEPGRERPGLWLDDGLGPGRPGILDLAEGPDPIAEFDAAFFRADGIARLRRRPAGRRGPLLDPATVRLGCPVARPDKILCVGRNYVEHARECGNPLPDRPVLFAKCVSAVIGPRDPIRLPQDAAVVDGEVELAVVVGRDLPAAAGPVGLDAVAGYMVLNDVTDREAQRAGGQWLYGKGADTFCPTGPFLLVPGPSFNPYQLSLQSRINGRLLQDGNTAAMHFSIETLLSYITARITLHPGDILATGTPAGIGSAQVGPRRRRTGGAIETEIQGLGRQQNPVDRIPPRHTAIAGGTTTHTA